MQTTTAPAITWKRTASIGTTLVMALCGLTGLASASSIDTTGPDSRNSISTSIREKCTVTNNNDVDVDNENDQSASTGDAKVKDNTFAGDAATGDAANANETALGLNIENDASACVCPVVSSLGALDTENSIEFTGPDSSNTITQNIRTETTVTNNNDVDINNSNDQDAESGKAEVKENTEGGDATTGDALNQNVTDFFVNIQNITPSVSAIDSVGNLSDDCGAAELSNGLGSSDNGVAGVSSVTPTGRAVGGFGGGGFGGRGGFVSGRGFVSSRPAPKAAPKAAHVAPVAPASSPAPVGGRGSVSVVTPPTAVSLPSNEISNTGPNSSNKILTSVKTDTVVTNTNNVSVNNSNNQSAYSGNASVSSNTSADSGGTGDASNGNATGAGASITN